MSNYKYQGKPLTVTIAVELIIEEFEGQSNIRTSGIVKQIYDNIHIAGGGLDSNYSEITTLIAHALFILKHIGFANNPRHGYWSFGKIDDVINWLESLK